MKVFTYRTDSLVRRQNTFHSFSSPIVVRPTVTACCETSSPSRARAALSGSMERANRWLPAVYSCPTYVTVASGRAARRSNAACISAPVPSKKTPQPAMKSVSPVKTTAAPATDEEGEEDEIEEAVVSSVT